MAAVRGSVLPFISRSLQAFGLVVVPAGLLYGINFHRAAPDHESMFVDRWSGGCQVFGDPADYQEFLGVVADSMTYTGSSFLPSYTLLDPP